MLVGTGFVDRGWNGLIGWLFFHFIFPPQAARR